MVKSNKEWRAAKTRAKAKARPHQNGADGRSAGRSGGPGSRGRSAWSPSTTDRFGETVSTQVRGGYDAAGWAGGRVAADRAKLTFGDLTEPVEGAS